MAAPTLPICLLVSAALFFSAYSYSFDCLDDCVCDVDQEVITCPAGTRETIFLPPKPLSNFRVLALIDNDIRSLPDEDIMLKHFPQLLLVDLQRNMHFDCYFHDSYSTVKIISECIGNSTDGWVMPRLEAPTPECDFSCTIKKHYKTLVKFSKELWESMKGGASEFTTFVKEKAAYAFKSVQDFFSD